MKVVPRLSDLPQPTTLAELLDLVGDLEGTRLDFKREPAKLTDLIPAMAMTDGGLIILGIANDRSLYGCELTQKVHDHIARAGHSVGVEVQLKELAVGADKVVVIAVPEVRGRIVTTPDGRLLRRIGSDNQPLIGDQLARFVRERSETSAEEEPILGPAEFDLDAVNRALAADGKGPCVSEDLVSALVDLGVAVPQAPPLDPRITVAAAVLFARDPRALTSGASVQLVRRTGVGPGPGPTEERVELSAPIDQLVDQVLDFVARHTKRYQVVIGARREVWPEYPTRVVREAVLNALAHRDYGRSGSTIDITIWDDRIEIRSPGGLPGPITLDNIRDEHYSRNRRIMRVLKQLNLVEEYGEGIDLMFSEMEARLMDPPLIVPTPDSVTVTLRNRFLVSIEDQAWLALLGSLRLTTAERRILVVARREGTITRRRAVQLLPDLDVDAVLRAAVAKGLLLRQGERGGAHYELSDEVVMRAGAGGVEARSRARQLLIDEIQRRGSLSTAEAADLVGEEPAIVRHLLNDLALAGVVEARGNTRARRYFATGSQDE